MKGDGQGRPLIDTAFNEWFARIAPDGRWVAYVSNESGQDDVWVARFPEADERQVISVGGGTMPAWRADGRELYYQSKDAIVAVAIELGDRLKAGPPQRLFDARALRADYRTRSFDVAPNGQFLLNVVAERKSLPLTVVTDWRAGLVK
jgi:eukaryotic-like serine/threonine-protein kinase